MIVEVCGIDGSGKSTLIRGLKGHYDRRADSWAYERTFRSRQRRFLESIALEAGRTRAEELFPTESMNLVDAVDLVEEATRAFYFDGDRRHQIYFVDHYHVEWLARVMASGCGSLPHVARVYARLPRPTLSFFLQLSASEALERIRARPGGDQVLQLESPLAALDRIASAFSQAISAVPYVVQQLDGRAPAVELRMRVIEEVEAKLASY